MSCGLGMTVRVHGVACVGVSNRFCALPCVHLFYGIRGRTGRVGIAGFPARLVVISGYFSLFERSDQWSSEHGVAL